MKKLAIQKSNISQELTTYFLNKDVDVCEFLTVDDIDYDLFDLIVVDDYEYELPINSINIHSSLLPAFPQTDAIEKAFMYGVKISGITISNNNNIIAQYPVFISTDMHFDEFKQEIMKAKLQLSKMIIWDILTNRAIDHEYLQPDLNNKPCQCVNCKGCH